MSRTIIEALNCHWPARISVQDIIISHTTNRNGILNINLDLNRVRLSLLSPHTTNVGRQFSCKTAMLTELPLSAQLQTKAQYPRNYPSLHSYRQKRNTHGTTPLCTATNKSAIPTELPLSAQLQTETQQAQNVCTIGRTLAGATGHAGVFIMSTVVSAQRLCRTVQELSLQATATDIVQPDGGHAASSEVRVAVGSRCRAARVNKDDPSLTHTSSNSNYPRGYL